MSIIRAQAVRYSTINYLATIIAAISTLWVYPLEWEAYGLAQFLVSFAMLCIPLATFGTLTLVVKFFPEFKAAGLRKSYLFNVLVAGFGSLAVAFILALLVNRPVLKFMEILSFDAYLIAKHKYAIAVMICILLYNSILITHASNYNKIAIPSLFQNLLPKFILPLLIVGVYLGLFDVAAFARFWVLSFGIASIGLTLYLQTIGGLDIRPQLHFFRRDKLRRLFGYSVFMGAGTLGNLLAGKIDLIMLGTLIGLKQTGVYSIALFIGNVLLIPATAVWQIASPVISDAFENKNWDRIVEVYKKSSTNLLVSGVFIYFLILGTLDAVLKFSPNYADIAIVVTLFAILGLAKLIDMGTSVNHHILAYSSRYRSTLIFVAIMAVLNIVLNYFLISYMGMIGAAISTCITTYFFQLLKCFYIERYYGIHPFSTMTPRILVLFLISLFYFLLLPDFASPILQAIIYAMGLFVVYYAAIRVLDIKSDISDTAKQHLSDLLARVLRR